MTGALRNYMTLMNQGYSLVTDTGWCGTNLKMGPEERKENYRAEVIDAVIDERLKREKKQWKNDETY